MGQRQATTTVCDRPGCEKRVTDKGSKMVMQNGDLVFLAPADQVDEGVPSADLCRECTQQIGNAWNRKAGDEPKDDSE
ncbi:MAG TPA: hypothetical protein VJP45_10460 [Candidatus Limnocylindria bacterium]|nr:hypothetical protein [Candidatus Limnocylindria bacterium]